MRIIGYSGQGWDHAWVTVDGEMLDPAPSQARRNHSPTGFAWGYGGSGPAQLALGILLHAGLGDIPALDGIPADEYSMAERLYQDFKFDVIAPLRGEDGPLDSFDIEVDLDEWLSKHGFIRQLAAQAAALATTLRSDDGALD